MSDDYAKYVTYKRKYLELKAQLEGQRRPGQRGGRAQRAGTLGSPIDETHFWGHQLMEHALFLHLGLEKNGLKARAKEIHDAWMAYMKKTFLDKGIDADKVVLDPQDEALAGSVDTREVMELIRKMDTFNDEVIALLESGEWIGWIFPSLAKHMKMESDYFKRKLQGPPLTPEEELIFANEHNSQEMGATAQLIDPAPENDPVIKKARDFAMKTMKNWSDKDKQTLQSMDVTDIATFLQLSLKYSRELTTFAKEGGARILKGDLKSIISPVLAKHNEREFDRILATLETLMV